jgi:putative FmdB family regulatory protein
MPLYEYRCQDCGEKFEKLTRIGSRDHEVTCPLCGSSRTKRAISLCSTGSGSAAGADVATSCAPAGGG